MASETKLGLNLIEAKVKVKYNYPGFVPAYIRITDGLGNSFPIQIVSHTQGKWLVVRNVRKHGTFKSQATTSFGEFNPNAKQFTFIGSEGLPPKHPTSSKNKVLNDEIKNGLNASNYEYLFPASQEISKSCPIQCERLRSCQD